MFETARYRLALLLVCVACLPGTAVAANLHFLILCDTLDPDIGTIDDFNIAQTWAQAIASNTALTLQLQSLTGSSLTVANAKTMLNNLQVNADDVVYFFYSGHGGNPGDRKWPIFYFTSSPGDMPDEQRLSFDWVLSALRPKNPKLLFVLADACNNFSNQSGQPIPHAQAVTGPAVTQAFLALFTDFTGEVLSSGCEPGQYSYGASGTGALYTNNYMNAFYTLAGQITPLTWEAVMAKARADTVTQTMSETPVQRPQYEIRSDGSTSLSTEIPLTGDPTGDPTSDPTGDPTGSEPLGTSSPACGPIGMGPLAMCAFGLTFMRARRGYRRVRV